jgi:hypothetical protein
MIPNWEKPAGYTLYNPQAFFLPYNKEFIVRTDLQGNEQMKLF